MKLYTYFRSSAAYRVRIALNLKGVAYEAIVMSDMEPRWASFSYAAGRLATSSATISFALMCTNRSSSVI